MRDRRKHFRKHRKTSEPKARDRTSEMKPKDRYSAAILDLDTRTTSFGHVFPSLNPSRNARLEELSQQLGKRTKQELPVLKTEIRHYSRAIDYCTYRLANCFTRHNDTVSSYISKMEKKIQVADGCGLL